MVYIRSKTCSTLATVSPLKVPVSTSIESPYSRAVCIRVWCLIAGGTLVFHFSETVFWSARFRRSQSLFIYDFLNSDRQNSVALPSRPGDGRRLSIVALAARCQDREYRRLRQSPFMVRLSRTGVRAQCICIGIGIGPRAKAWCKMPGTGSTVFRRREGARNVVLPVASQTRC